LKALIFIAFILLVPGSLPAFAQENASPAETKAAKEKAAQEYQQKLKEYNQKVAEIEEKNKKIAENNEKINQLLAEGNKAFNERNYQSAIEKFDEAYKLDPDFAGSAPVLLNNKALALRMFGAEKYNNAIAANKNPAIEANQYFLDAVSALQESLKILDSAPVTTDEPVRKIFEVNRYLAIAALAECYRLLVLTDETRVYEAITAFENYIKIEKDELKNQKWRENLKKLKAQFKIDY